MTQSIIKNKLFGFGLLYLLAINTSYAGSCDFLHITLNESVNLNRGSNAEPIADMPEITRIQKDNISNAEIKKNIQISENSGQIAGCPKSIIVTYVNMESELSKVLANGGVYHLAKFKKDARDNSNNCKYFLDDDFTYNDQTGQVEISKSMLECNNVDWSQLIQVSSD